MLSGKGNDREVQKEKKIASEKTENDPFEQDQITGLLSAACLPLFYDQIGSPVILMLQPINNNPITSPIRSHSAIL